MKKVKKMRFACIGLLLLLLAGVVAWNVRKAVGYARVVENFKDNKRNEPYAQGIPLEEMDLSVYQDYVHLAQAAILQDFTLAEIMELPCDVHYYELKEDKAPILALKKGTKVYTIPPGKVDFDDSDIGYGFKCWPDYQKGWRFGRPFVLENDAESFDEAPYYFVKTPELEATARAFYHVSNFQYRTEGVSLSNMRYGSQGRLTVLYMYMVPYAQKRCAIHLMAGHIGEDMAL